MERSIDGGPPNTREKAYRLIQHRIVSGHYRPGLALSELAIAKELGISRTPVREAIGQLVAENLVEQIPNRGAVVARLNRQDIVDLYELREALEVFCIRKVALAGLASQEIDAARQAIESVDNIHADLIASGTDRLTGDLAQRFLRSDLAFHTSLLRAAANRRILRALSDTRLLIRIFAIRHDGHTSEQLQRIRHWHAEILDAVLRRDPDTAGEILTGHIRTSCRERLDALDAEELRSMGSRYLGAD